MKKISDFFLAIILLCLALPLILMIAFIIRIKMGAPILFIQTRSGQYGLPFNLYKFRTMNDEIDERGKVLSDDRRLTILGEFLRKYSLDELPQLINVIKGEM